MAALSIAIGVYWAMSHEDANEREKGVAMDGILPVWNIAGVATGGTGASQTNCEIRAKPMRMI